MENITTKLKTRFSSSYANASADRQDENIEVDSNSSASYVAIARNILRFVFRTPKRSMLAIALIGALAVGGYYFFDKPTQEERARKELAAAVAAAGKLIILPQGDEPVLATVTDAATLTKQQAFFTGAVNGDQLLLFPRNLKAVIYSPSRKMIVNVGPIQQQPAVAAGDSQPPISNSRTNSNNQIPNDLNKKVLMVEIRNGTGKTGLAEQTAQEIGKNGKFNVINVADAQKKNYSKTTLYIKTEDAEKLLLASELASSIGATAISKIPAGEKSTDADALVILGGE